jgi:hypothetical protein
LLQIGDYPRSNRQEPLIRNPVEDRRQGVLKSIPHRGHQIHVRTFQDIAPDPVPQLLRGEDRRGRTHRGAEDDNRLAGALPLQEFHRRDNVVPGAVTAIIEITRRIAMSPQ